MRDYARTTLKPRHRPVVRAFAEALFRGQEPIPEERLAGFAEEVDRFVSPASKTLRFGLLVVLDLIRWAPLFVMGRFAAFEDLPFESRVKMLDRMERSKLAPLTLMLVAYKTMMTVLFFEDPRELAAIGYPGPERERYKRALAIAREARGEHR
jgi:hypothetical protein